MVDAVLEFEGIAKSYRSGDDVVAVLDHVDFQVGSGERVAVMGASGSGKTTLLHLAGGMDRPDTGAVRVLGVAVDGLAEPARTRYRARHIGLIFQDFNLLDSLNAFENIELPLWLNGLARRRERVCEIAGELGIENLLGRLPGQLSGGEQQRVAIARALVHRPNLILADEPTGSLDSGTATGVLELLAEAADRHACALVLATHSERAAAVCQRRLVLANGRLAHGD